MKGKLGRPSPALAISLIALFVALGGTSYGLARNSIDTREIKNNDVRSADLRNNDVRSGDIRAGGVQSSDVADDALTGSDVNEGSLGTVPNASRAASAGRADSAGTADSATTASNAGTLGGLAPEAYAKATIEAPHIVGKPGQPAFENGWNFFQSDNVGFFKDQFGMVYLQGALDPGDNPANGSAAFTLPQGYRPTFLASFPGREGPGVNSENEDCRITVFTTGAVQVNTTPATTSELGSCRLDGILFRAG
jgi:hypothetical protein